MRISAFVFAGTLVFAAIAFRPALRVHGEQAIARSHARRWGSVPAGSLLGVDAWRKQPSGGEPPERLRAVGSVRFLQLFCRAITIYSASGIAKARGD